MKKIATVLVTLLLLAVTAQPVSAQWSCVPAEDSNPQCPLTGFSYYCGNPSPVDPSTGQPYPEGNPYHEGPLCCNNQASCESTFPIVHCCINGTTQPNMNTQDCLAQGGSPLACEDNNNPNQPGNYNLLNGPSSDDFNALNPLRRPDADSAIADQFATPAGLISRVLLFAFPIAGILMLLMLVWGGFEILSGATNKKSLDSGKNRIKAGIAGFMLLFTSYWIVQVIEVVLGIQIF